MTGLLEDQTDAIEALERGSAREIKMEAMFDWIVESERNGVALTHMSGNNSVYKRSEDADAPESLQGLSKRVLEQYVRDLQAAGRINKFQLSAAGGKIWLGAVDGDMSRGEYEPTTARDNV